MLCVQRGCGQFLGPNFTFSSVLPTDGNVNVRVEFGAAPLDMRGKFCIEVGRATREKGGDVESSC